MVGTMKAARLYGPRDIRIDEIPLPVCGPGQVLVRVRAVSVCPSDYRMYVDGHAGGVRPDVPIIQGHEFSGDVVEVGDGVSSMPVDARVAVEPTWPCGRCDMCCDGKGNLCRHVRFPSFPPTDGALTELIACPAESVCVLPDGLDYIQGALVEPLGVAMHAVELVGSLTGRNVAILGAGIIGISVMYLTRAQRRRSLVMVEPEESRRSLPKRVGVDRLVASWSEARDAGCEADVVFECSGGDDAFEQALKLARPGGTVCVVGIPHVARVDFDIAIPRRRELTVIFSRRSYDTVARAVELLDQHVVDYRGLPIHRCSLAETGAAMERTGQPGPVLRVVVEP